MGRAALPGGLLLLLSLAGAAPAQPPPSLDSTDAFERGFAVSLYQFDACGDPLAGRMFRRALAERFGRCPFSAEARDRYARRTRAEQAKVRRILEELIEAEGGMPQRLAGMAETCRAQQGSEEYRRFRARLEAYERGELTAESILPAACDASDILP